MNKCHIQTTTHLHLLCSSADALSSVNVLRLEWQRIHRIENLDFFTNLTDLYLQHNQIEVIENLDAHVCPQLSFLALANNKIRRVENIVHLSKLQFLDLSENQIDDVDERELPPNLTVLKVTDSLENQEFFCLVNMYVWRPLGGA